MLCMRQIVPKAMLKFATLDKKEVRQVVITEGSRIRASLDGQTGAPGSSAEQPAALAGAASSAEQPAVAGCTAKQEKAKQT